MILISKFLCYLFGHKPSWSWYGNNGEQDHGPCTRCGKKSQKQIIIDRIRQNREKI